MTRPSRTLALLLLLAPAGCGIFVPRTDYSAEAQAAVAQAKTSADDRVSADLDKARLAAVSDPGAVDPARVFAQHVAGAYELGVIERKELDGEGLLREAGQALDKAGAAHADQLAELEFSRGAMLLSAKKTEPAVDALRASMKAKPSPRACVALIAELDKQGDPKKEIVPACKAALPNVASDETRFALLDGCLRHTHAGSADSGLAWAGPGAAAFYRDYQAKLDAEERARRAEDERRRQEQLEEMRRASAASASGGSASRTSSGGGTPGASGWSLELKNNCAKTVRLFLGQKPKFGSGTSTTLGSNTISSYSGRDGDMIWIVDEHDNGLSSLSPSGRQRMQITSSCSGFAPN